MSSLLTNASRRKPPHLVREQAHLSDLPSSPEEDAAGVRSSAPRRHMTLLDLLLFGVGSTVGTGVFVLTGVVASRYAGPSASLSYLAAGAVAAFSGLPYAELSALIPLGGSTYAFAYATLGEGFAVLASLCQTLEYGVSAAAVGRSWGDKVVDLALREEDDGGGFGVPGWVHTLLDPGWGVNPLGAVIVAACALLLLCGVRESKAATNFVSAAKMFLIIFMIAGGFLLALGVGSSDNDNEQLASFSNWSPFVPPEFGFSGILRGSSVLFFAYIGFDQVCNLSGESVNPTVDVPRAVMLVLLVDVLLYMAAALALTAMLPYEYINEVAGFPRAFQSNGWIWAEKMTAIGEIVTLPLVVLTATQSQSRLMFAMSGDGLVPRLFGRLSYGADVVELPIAGSGSSDEHDGDVGVGAEQRNDGMANGGDGGKKKKRKKPKIGNPTANIRACGAAVAITAAFVPFQYLDDLISAGVLFLFSLTDVCLLAARYRDPRVSFWGEEKAVEMCVRGEGEGARDDGNSSVVSVPRSRLRTGRLASLGVLLLSMNVFSFASGLCYAYILNDALRSVLAGFFALLVLAATLHLARRSQQSEETQFALESSGDDGSGRPPSEVATSEKKKRKIFRTPLVPYFPAFGIFLNWFMLANIEWVGIALLFGYMTLGMVGYAIIGAGHSAVANDAASTAAAMVGGGGGTSSPPGPDGRFGAGRSDNEGGGPLRESLLPEGETESELGSSAAASESAGASGMLA